jgi:hypothetical protein
LIPGAEGNHPSITFLTKVTPALLLAQPFTPKQRCTLGSVEALASTDARRDHAVLELFGYFFFQEKK